MERRESEGLRPRTIEHLDWTLTHHLLPAFARDRLDVITVERIDRYVQAKLREKRLNPAQLNRTLATLAAEPTGIEPVTACLQKTAALPTCLIPDQSLN